MVYLEFVGIDGANVVHDYKPESKDAPSGRIAMNRKTKKRRIIDEAKGDEWSAYKGHAWKRIGEMIDAGELKKETYSAWY